MIRLPQMVTLLQGRIARHIALCIATVSFTLSSGLAQQLPATPTPSSVIQPPPLFRSRGWWPVSYYKEASLSAPKRDDLSGMSNFIREGKISLTLQDAIAMAIQNNFDVELQRYDPRFAQAEILRARGGGQLRGIPTAINELPSGVGGPGEPLLTAVGGYTPILQLPSSAADLATITGTQTDGSILSSTPYSQGTAVPQFDPSIGANLSLAQVYYPQSTAFSTGLNYYSSHTASGSVSYNQGFATGTIFNTTFSAQRLKEASTRINLNPFVTGALSVSISQPLLRGFGIHINKRFIRIAHNEGRIAQDVFTQQLISTISDTIRLYWDLVSLQQDLEVKRQTLESSETLFRDTKNEVDLGTQAPVDLTSAQAQLASNRQAYINAQGSLLQQQLLLKELLTRRGISDSSLATASIIAITPMATPVSNDIKPIEKLLSDAMEQRPDLELAKLQEDSSRQALKGSRNALLPELNVVASMQNNGGAGSLNTNLSSTNGIPAPPPPDKLIGGYGTAVSQIFSRDYPDYVVGFQLSMPITNKIARADMARDQLLYQQSQVQLSKLQSRIRLQVGNAFIALQQAKESYKASMEARSLQEQAVEVERAKFDAGVATAYEFMQYQNALAQAKSATVTALGVYAKAKIAIQRATASILDDNNIQIDDAYANHAQAPR